VDTSSYKEGYNAGSSSAFSFYNVRAPRHVDVRPRSGKPDQTGNASQLRPIEWNREKGLDASSQFHYNPDPACLKWEEVRVHAALMLERLRFQKEQYNVVGPSPEWMVEQSLAKGPEFTAEWSSKWKQARFDWAGIERVDPVVDHKDCIQFNDYNSCYAPFFFIFWVEESTDYEYMFHGEPAEDDETLEQLEEVIAQLSEELLPDADFSVPDSVIWSPVSSNGYEGAGETRPEWEIEFDDPHTDYISDHLRYLRGQAMKRPSETRDIGTLTPQSMRLHRRIMYPMQQACRKIPGCVYGRDQAFIKRVVTHIGEKSNYYYMRDYTKSGMTMPKAVRRAILRGFYRRSPEIMESAIRAFDRQVVEFKIEGGTEARNPHTGSPLGMFVEGFTLLQYAVDRMVKASMFNSETLKFSATNDDMIVGSPSYEQLRAYVDRDVFIQMDLGMLVKGTKSGISKSRFFFCEEYWDFDHIVSKESLSSLAILGAKFAINVVQAKELVNSILLSLPYWSDTVKRAVTEVQVSYDYEFSDQEIHWPFLFGGWWPTYRDGLDSSIEWRNGDFIADAAYWACREKPKKSRELKMLPSLSYARMKGLTLIKKPDDPSDYISLIPLFGTKKGLRDYYTLLSRKPADLKRYYRDSFIARQRAFKGIINGTKEMEPVLSGWLRRHPGSVIMNHMLGVTYSTDVFSIQKPSVGVGIPDTEVWLWAMADLGYIEYPGKRKISGSAKSLVRCGIHQELQYDYLLVDNNKGISLEVLKQKYKGLEDFFFRTGRTILAIDEYDSPLPLARHWGYLNAPLVWIERIEKYSYMYPQLQLGIATGEFWFKYLCDNFRVPDISWGAQEEVKKSASGVVQFEAQFLDSLRLMLGQATAEVRAKIVPLNLYPGYREPEEVPTAPPGAGGDLIMIGEGSYVPADYNYQPLWDDESQEDEVFDMFAGM
jgi:hypothetical protein